MSAGASHCLLKTANWLLTPAQANFPFSIFHFPFSIKKASKGFHFYGYALFYRKAETAVLAFQKY
jgi:hypothetical protein